MEWIKDYWYFVVLGLIAVVLMLNRRPKSLLTDDTDPRQTAAHTNDKSHTGGHGCCH